MPDLEFCGTETSIMLVHVEAMFVLGVQVQANPLTEINVHYSSQLFTFGLMLWQTWVLGTKSGQPPEHAQFDANVHTFVG